eukprot:603082-Pyramimonas_sp.AAC.1
MLNIFPVFAGIGKSLAEKLAMQGINVVLVALQEPLLMETFETLQAQFPDVEFRKIICTIYELGVLGVERTSYPYGVAGHLGWRQPGQT